MLLHHGALSALASLLGLFWDERHLLTYYNSFAFQYPFAGEYLEAIRVLGCLFLFLFIFPPFYFASLSSVGSQALFIASGFLSKMVSWRSRWGFLGLYPAGSPRSILSPSEQVMGPVLLRGERVLSKLLSLSASKGRFETEHTVPVEVRRALTAVRRPY